MNFPCYIGMTLRLIHVQKLVEASTYVVGSKANLGSFGVTGVKRSFVTKNGTSTDYMAWL